MYCTVVYLLSLSLITSHHFVPPFIDLISSHLATTYTFFHHTISHHIKSHHQAELKTANAEIERLKKLLLDMTTAKTASDARITALEGQGKKDTAEIAALKKQLAGITEENSLTEDEVASLKKQVAELSQGKVVADKRIR